MTEVTETATRPRWQDKEPCRKVLLELPVSVIEAFDMLSSEETVSRSAYMRKILIGFGKGFYRIDWAAPKEGSQK